MNTEQKQPFAGDIMKAIRAGEIRMRPRWHFLLLSALSIIGAFIVFLTLLYVASLGIFFLRDSGVLFAPSFGLRGWFSLAHSLPWLLIGFLFVFVVILELLVRKFAFVYKKPLLTSVLGIITLILVGGFFIAQTPLHHTVMVSVRRGELPPPVGAIYGVPVRMPRPDDVYHGRILSIAHGGFIIVDEDGAGTTSVVVTPQTRLPYGEDFATGTRVMIVGDAVATGTVRAFGVREIDEYPDTEITPPPGMY